MGTRGRRWARVTWGVPGGAVGMGAGAAPDRTRAERGRQRTGADAAPAATHPPILPRGVRAQMPTTPRKAQPRPEHKANSTQRPLAALRKARYVGEVILRDRDNAGDSALEERRVYLQNWRADVVAVTRDDGLPLEYVRYSSYGEATVYPVADVNRDGVVNATDAAEWDKLMAGTSNSCAVDADLDRNGDAGTPDDQELFDDSYSQHSGLSGVGRVSSASVGNRKGYAGYEWDETLSVYHVRHRMYLPEIGRWSRRDPLGYVDGMSLYQYVAGMAVRAVDPSGMMSMGRVSGMHPGTSLCNVAFITSNGGGSGCEGGGAPNPGDPPGGGGGNSPPPMADRECCSRVHSPRRTGRVVCCQGRLVSCSYYPGGNGGEPSQCHNPPSTNPDIVAARCYVEQHINRCVLIHENDHHDDVQSCNSGSDPYIPNWRPELTPEQRDAAECSAYNVEVPCLDRALAECDVLFPDTGETPNPNVACKENMRRHIERVKTWRSKFCRPARPSPQAPLPRGQDLNET